MDNVKHFVAKCRPSEYLKRMREHSGEVSEGSSHKILAIRRILGKVVTFYRNGLREIKNTDLSEQEVHESEVLNFVHASLLIDAPVGDKKACYVDATKQEVEVWIKGKRADLLVKETLQLHRLGKAETEALLDEPTKILEKPNV